MILFDKTQDFEARVRHLEEFKQTIQRNDGKSQGSWTNERFVKEYERLSDNKSVYAQKTLKNNLKQEYDNEFNKKFGFKPFVNPVSKESQTENQKSRFEALYRNYQEKEDKILSSKLIAMEAEVNECTFAPKLYSKRPSSVHTKKTAEKVNKKTSGESFLEKELALCTFHPKITKETIKSDRELPRGYQEFIEKSKKIIETKIHQKELEKRPCGENYEKYKMLKFNPPSFLDREKDVKNVLVYVDVNLKPGKKGKIAIREGDDPKLVAESFCRVYSLGKDCVENLQDALACQLNKLKY